MIGNYLTMQKKDRVLVMINQEQFIKINLLPPKIANDASF